jgi:hypothetical protein
LSEAFEELLDALVLGDDDLLELLDAPALVVGLDAGAVAEVAAAATRDEFQSSAMTGPRPSGRRPCAAPIVVEDNALAVGAIQLPILKPSARAPLRPNAATTLFISGVSIASALLRPLFDGS